MARPVNPGNPRVAVVTTAAPPSPSGQARVLAQIIIPQCAPEPIYFTDQMNAVEKGDRYGGYVELAAPRFLLIPRLPTKALARLNNVAGLTQTVLARAVEIARHLRKDPVDVVVGCSGSPFDLPAAHLAARWLQRPFVAYLFDDPVYQWEPGVYRPFARFWERAWGAGAKLLLVPNEFAAEDIRRRLPKAEIRIIRNPAAVGVLTECSRSTGLPDKAPAEPSRLLYTGSVYSAQASAFRNLISALEFLGGRFRLDVYTAQSMADLVANGVVGSSVQYHSHVSQSVALELQRSADILFLPLAFDAPIPEVIRSSSPAKLAEYLAAGRPILVHAPADSFVSDFFRRTGAGVVVDRPDPHLLAQALESLAQDDALRDRLIANARRVAPDFHVEKTCGDFWSALGSIGP